jgi:hypothetical protein
MITWTGMFIRKLSSVIQYPSALTVHPCSRTSTSSTCKKSHNTLPADDATCVTFPIPGWARTFPPHGWSVTGGTELRIHVSSSVTTQCGYDMLKETETGDRPCCTVVCCCMKHPSSAHLIAGMHKFSKDLAVPQNSRHQKDDMKVAPEDPQIEHATVQNLVATVTWYWGLCTPALQSCNTSILICYTEPPGKLRSDALCCKASLEWVPWHTQYCFLLLRFTWHKTSTCWWLISATNTSCPHNKCL